MKRGNTFLDEIYFQLNNSKTEKMPFVYFFVDSTISLVLLNPHWLLGSIDTVLAFLYAERARAGGSDIRAQRWFCESEAEAEAYRCTVCTEVRGCLNRV